MASLTQESFPSIWRVLGLSVAAGFAGLGTYAMSKYSPGRNVYPRPELMRFNAVMPVRCASAHGLRPKVEPEGDEFASRAMSWIGVRDVSIGASLLWFYYQGKPAEMGTVIMSGMIVCVADVYLVYQHRQDYYPFMLGAGAALWGWIGWNLRKL